MGSRGGLRRLLLSRTRRASRSLHGLSPGDLVARFGARTHLVRFGSTTQAVELARRYLHETEERRRIARQGREHVLARHTYDHRAREMLAVVRRLLDASARPAGAAS